VFFPSSNAAAAPHAAGSPLGILRQQKQSEISSRRQRDSGPPRIQGHSSDCRTLERAAWGAGRPPQPPRSMGKDGSERALPPIPPTDFARIFYNRRINRARQLGLFTSRQRTSENCCCASAKGQKRQSSLARSDWRSVWINQRQGDPVRFDSWLDQTFNLYHRVPR